MLELRQLRYFTAIVDAGSLTRAASALYIAQPALSQQLAALESDLGIRLLNRGARGAKPTAAGLELYKHAQVILKLAAETKNVVTGSAERVSGRVRIGLPSTIAVILVAPLVAALRQEHPGILLEVYESPSSYLAAQLIEERVDLSILVGDSLSDGLRVEPLVDEHLYFVYSETEHLPGGPTSIRLEDLADRPIVLPARSTTLRHLVDLAFRKAGIEPRVYAETSSIQSLLTLVAQGDMGTFVPYSALSWHSANASLCAILIEPAIVRKAQLAHSRMIELTSASQCVKQTLLVVVRKMVEEGHWQGATLSY
ncbi:LysR substrate-binding domain-containing protein [Variovorax sp. EL159]|uniref:LysR substrate-binding domain-containing protein n=1 Tax=Variovorax sp. EL159 TaxID=1566270 RepID=UPI00087E5EAE|nr:LysR substrate-binding domain-containing protein [Variovorax sp. EL159]SCX72566.1 LysR family transcriptional regulator, nitrogen assimilation regulatory protein [Variovorax sp. EL159]